MDKNAFMATLPADSVEELDHIDWEIQSTARPGPYRVEMQILASDSEILSTNATEITVR